MDDRPLEFHPDARKEAVEAYEWYAERSLQAAEAFREELTDAGRAIRELPERWAVYLGTTRRYVLKRFPFAVVYRLSETRIEILAVAHGKRRPGYWKSRLEPE